MSTYLEISQDVRRECDIGGTGPTTVASQTGELENIVKWVRDEYTKIQNRHYWRWLRATATLTTVASQDSYAYSEITDDVTASAITRFKKWRIEDRYDPPKIYLASSGSGTERWLIYTPWESFKTVYKIGTQNDGSPVHITFDPADNIVIGPSPDAVYTITLDYHKSAQILTDDADIPEMPTDYHLLIQYMAMIRYGFSDAAPEVIQDARIESKKLMRQLENNQMPKMKLGKSLA